MKRRILLAVAPLLAGLALFACSSDSSSGPGGLGGGGGGDGGAADDGGGTTGKEGGPGVDAGPPPITVIVTARTAAKPGITVVWHDASGAVTGTSTTGPDGRASSAGMPTPAMASALLGKADGTTEVVTWTGLEAGDQLLARDLDDNAAVVGHFDVTMPGDPDNGATQYMAMSGACASQTTNDPTGNVDIPLTGPCIRNTSSILARALDDNGAVLSYAYLNGKVPPQNGATVPVNMLPAFTDPVTMTISATNLNGANVTPALVEIADDLPFPNGTGDTQNDVTTYQIAQGFADFYQMGLLEQPAAGATRIVGRRAPPAAAFTLDWSQALPVLTDVTTDTTNPGRPKISWTAATTLAAADGGLASIVWSAGGQKHGWTLVVPPGTTTGTVGAPALPPAASAWSFPASTAVDASDVVIVESDALAGYRELRASAAAIVPGVHDAARLSNAVLTGNGSFRATELRPN